MSRRARLRHTAKETPEPLKPVVTAVIQIAVGALLFVALILIVEHTTNPRVLTFDFLFR